MTIHVPHSGQAVAVSLTEITELGAAYRPDEVRAIADVAHAHGCAVHMDGARFANAIAALGCSPADITWRAGVDVLSFGGTKNGCLAAEALVFFDKAPARDAAFQRQRAGQGFSKNWFIAAQLDAYLKDDHWLELAGHANGMAARLAAAIERSGEGRLALRPDGNEIFAVLSKAADERLKAGRRASTIRGRRTRCPRPRGRGRTRCPCGSSAAGRRRQTTSIASPRCWRETSCERQRSPPRGRAGSSRIAVKRPPPAASRHLPFGGGKCTAYEKSAPRAGRSSIRTGPREVKRRPGRSGPASQPALMAMVRGFMASGMLRTRSTWSRPFSSVAPFTSTWSASWKRRSKAREAIPR